MTDAAMASLSTISTTGLGLPAGGMEALKYAAQADMFQDDPNFYAWLEEWTGKGDDESIMIDAFNTLTDYGMQFEFQQQQQQQLESSASAVRFPAEENAFLAGNNSLNAETALPQKLHQAQLGSLPGAASSCPSLASNCISRPGERNCHWGLRSPPESSVGNSSASLSSAALSPYSFSSCPAAPDAATAMAMSVAPEVNPNSGSAGISAASDAGPFDAASFIAPLTRGLDTYHVPADVSCLLGNSIDPAASTPPSAFPEIRVPSHGTVTSYAGAPSPIVQNSVSNPGPPAAGPPVVGTTTTAPGSGGGLRPELLNAPSLEQLIVRAICGNCVGAVDGRRAADPATANPSSGVAGGLSSLGMAVLGAGGFGHPSTAIGSGVAGEMGASALTSCFVRDSSGSLGDGATDSAVCSMDEDSRSGSGRFTSLGMPTQQGSSMRSMPTTCAGGPSAGARTHGLRLKSSFSGGPAGPHAYGWHGHGHGHGPPHHHYHGNPVSNIHRHSHVGKAVAAACGVGGSRSMVGVNAYGKPTRSARSKAVFAALEAEVAGKLSELEALQHENATLTQRVEILEVAVERQSSVLNLMTAAITAERGTAAAATSATRAAPARPPVGGEAAVKQSWPLPGIDTGAENATTMAAGKVPASASESAAGRDLVATGPELLEWARKCTLEMYVAWYKEHLQVGWAAVQPGERWDSLASSGLTVERRGTTAHRSSNVALCNMRNTIPQ
ncbi:hypothetical protein Vretifemale_8796 [Volvox reticuliferus]|uniref:Uncharacterized protein n=1 Tax=Volvox reticuliferus TaxID=1737510 RepID=A0A8J4CHB2_9CHLO|nr:hypothetical protein Vretifemale_8796 [Volvox reticuliferus]